MKPNHQPITRFLFYGFALAIFVVFASPVLAVEGGLGRPNLPHADYTLCWLGSSGAGFRSGSGRNVLRRLDWWRSKCADSRTSSSERRYEGIFYSNLATVHLAYINKDLELCLSRCISTGLARGRGKRFPRTIVGSEKRQHLRVIRSG